MMAVAIAASSGLLVTSATNERSILSASIGKRLRYDSEEWPAEVVDEMWILRERGIEDRRLGRTLMAGSR